MEWEEGDKREDGKSGREARIKNGIKSASRGGSNGRRVEHTHRASRIDWTLVVEIERMAEEGG